jgi:hypothetical protein
MPIVVTAGVAVERRSRCKVSLLVQQGGAKSVPDRLGSWCKSRNLRIRRIKRRRCRRRRRAVARFSNRKNMLTTGAAIATKTKTIATAVHPQTKTTRKRPESTLPVRPWRHSFHHHTMMMAAAQYPHRQTPRSPQPTTHRLALTPDSVSSR